LREQELIKGPTARLTVSLPGPSGGPWALGLLAWALAVVVLGDVVRQLAGRLIPSWRRLEPIERGLTDFYLGGGLLYLLAALPVGLFVAPLVDALPLVGAVGLAGWVLLRRRASAAEGLLQSVVSIFRPASLLVLGSAAALYALELATAVPIGTGNTFDSGLLTTYTALLVQNHTIPLSFQPYATPSILYPQGTTVWLGWAQLVFGLPAARTSLLVTPLFFALAPLAGFVFGRKLFGTDRAGLATALMLAWLAPATRGMVAGSNDFVFAFPLVLMLSGQAVVWLRSPPPRAADAVGFGLLAGYSAAMNPVGAEWLFLALLVAGGLAHPAYGGRLGSWFLRWATALATTLLGITPSLYILALGRSSPGFVPGAAAAPAGFPVGISGAQFLGSIDPFLFRAQDVQLSPVPALRLELALLLLLGLAVLLLVARSSVLGRYFESFRLLVAGAIAATVALLAVVWGASTGFGPAVDLNRITSAAELSTWLFTMYVFIASVPLILALERFHGTFVVASGSAVASGPVAQRPYGGGVHRAGPSRTLIPLAVALLVVLPGVALTPTALSPVWTRLYHDFGNVTSDDFALLDYAGNHLPAGARVLVAPGSAGDFLPGYVADLVILYPLVPGWSWVNASYRIVVDELSNGTLDARGLGAMAALDVQYIVVTGNNTVLWPAFSPAPLTMDPGAFPELFHQGDAYLFARSGA
jgi:hypothetical protein